MSLETPTTAEISENIIAQLQASLNQSIPLLPKSFLRVLAKALAGVFILLYKYAGFMFLQIFVQSASANETMVNGEAVTPLTAWGRLIGVGDPAPATNAELNIEIKVETQSGILPSGSQLVSLDNGVTYITIGDVLLNAPLKMAIVRAASDQSGGNGEGAIGNLSSGSKLSFANPLPNVSRNAVVISQNVTGSDAEKTEAYRQRVIDRFQKRPQGGAYADYEIWGEEPPGILNIYPYTSDCPGQVDVYVEATIESSGSADGIPTEAQLIEVLESIDFDQDGLASRRPANALVNAFPITRTPFAVEILGLKVDNLDEVQAAIRAAITEYFLERAPFIIGLSILPRFDRITSSGIGGVIDSIVSATGGIFSTVIVRNSGIEIDLYSLGIGEKAKAESIVFL